MVRLAPLRQAYAYAPCDVMLREPEPIMRTDERIVIASSEPVEIN